LAAATTARNVDDDPFKASMDGQPLSVEVKVKNMLRHPKQQLLA
jgi:hypothetical protein